MKRAFTLIELLVVIAIIAILAAILFPVFARAKDSAKQTGDVSGSRQIAMAFQMYMADYDDHYPPLVSFQFGSGSVPDNFGFFRWPWLLQPYVKSFDLFWSPADTLDTQFRDMRPDHPINGYVFGLVPSCGYNQRTFSPEAPPLGYSPISASGIQEPAGTVLLASSIWWTLPTDPKTGYYRIFPPDEWAGTSPLSGLSYGHVWPRHRGTHATVVYGDSHTKAMAIDALRDPTLWDSM